MIAIRRPQRGVTLVEMMVAIVITLIVSAAVVAIFVSSKKAYVTQDKLARVQENGRFAMYYLMQDLRMAKYMGCLENVDNVVYNNLNIAVSDFSFGSVIGPSPLGVDSKVQKTDPVATPLEGIDDVDSASTWFPSGSNALPTTYKASVPSNTTDMLTIRRAIALADVVARLASETDPVRVSDLTYLTRNQVVLLANCEAGELFQISDIDTSNSTLLHATTGNAQFTPGNRTAAFGKTGKLYGSEAQILAFVTRTYYVDVNANGIPSLFRRENGTSVELVEGIESLQILYGVSNGSTSQPAQYLPAGSVTNWDNVVSVKIGILARTSSENFGDANATTYTVNGTSLGPFNDRNDRRVFEATVSLKSKVL